MTDYGLGYVPIAGPKNSSSNLELCHLVPFLFRISSFCPRGCKKSTGGTEHRPVPHPISFQFFFVQLHPSSPTEQPAAGEQGKVTMQFVLTISQCGRQHTITQFSNGQSDTMFTSKASTLFSF